MSRIRSRQVPLTWASILCLLLVRRRPRLVTGEFRHPCTPLTVAEVSPCQVVGRDSHRRSGYRNCTCFICLPDTPKEFLMSASPQYEFTREQNTLVDSLAGRMRF